MSQHQIQNSFFNISAGSISNFTNFNPTEHQQQQEDLNITKSPRKRRDETVYIVDRLYQATFRQHPGEKAPVRTSQRRNRNEVYALANAILVKELHLDGIKYTREMELSQNIKSNLSNGEFLLILRTDGRIVVMSEEAEHHLGKSVRLLYTQCINMFDCLDKTDAEKLRSILNSSANDFGEEHQLVCTVRLPKGKRPSREREDIKAITITGHFYSCHEPFSTSHEKLFIARCQTLLPQTANPSGSSQTTSINTNQNSNIMLTFTLNEDMSIHSASATVEDILGYRKRELDGVSFGRLLPTDDLKSFEKNREKSFQHGQTQQNQPNSVCDIFDIYTKNGDGRLSCLYQIRPIRERRARTIKFLVTAQLIDPSLRDDYMRYVQSDSTSNNKPVKVEQVNLVSPSTSKTSEDSFMASSPSLSGGLLENININDYLQQISPFNRSFSDVVAPLNFNEPSWPTVFNFEWDEQPIDGSVQCNSNQFFSECSFNPPLADLHDIDFELFLIEAGFC